MKSRRSLMRILAGAAILSVERRATAQKAKSFTIAYLALLPGEDRMSFSAKFVRRLNELGYVDGQNLRFIYRSAEGQPELLPSLASDLVRMEPDVLVTGFGTVAAKAGKAAGAASPLSLWLLVIPSAPGLLRASPDRAETSPDCRTLRLTCRATGFSSCAKSPLPPLFLRWS